VEAFLERVLPQAGSYPQPLADAMRYSALDGGKRLRPALTLAAAESVGGDPERSLPIAAAIEMIHSYSLVHDDLPAMDDDNYRRGKLTCHRRFTEATAILAGDALLTQAFQVMGEAEGITGTDRLAIIVEIARACGPAGLIGGQMADLEAEGQEIELPALEYIHTHKTGALIQASVRCGGIVAGGNRRQLEALSSYGRRVGLGFQIIDDILDIEANPEETGKETGRDRRRNKATYPALFGLDFCRQRARELIEEAEQALDDFGQAGDRLRELARFVEQRNR
jgi:geranylgeranyl diphosphate synthase type II